MNILLYTIANTNDLLTGRGGLVCVAWSVISRPSDNNKTWARFSARTRCFPCDVNVSKYVRSAAVNSTR